MINKDTNKNDDTHFVMHALLWSILFIPKIRISIRLARDAGGERQVRPAGQATPKGESTDSYYS